MGGWIQELLKLAAGAAIGVTVYVITDSIVNTAQGDVTNTVQKAGQEMQPSK